MTDSPGALPQRDARPGFGAISDEPVTILLTGGRVLDPQGADSVRNLAVRDGRIVSGAALPPGATRLDVRGSIVVPGFVDLHTHLRAPGDETAETIETGTQAAARGGFTTVCAMPNTDPPIDDARQVNWLQSQSRHAACRVRVIAAATEGRRGATIAEYESVRSAGAIAVSDDGSALPSRQLAETALRELARLGLALFEHAEDPELVGDSVMREGRTALRLGLIGRSPDAELRIVNRDIAAAAETGGWVHFTHLSTAAGLESVRRAKSRGLRVTCDVTPHHIAMTDEWVAGDRRFVWEADAQRTVPAYDTSTRVNPPLGSAADAAQLLSGLEDGTVDAIATDHAPHPAARKAVPFQEASPGMVGLETALGIGLAAVRAGRIQLRTLIAALSTQPARLLGEEHGLREGLPANIVVIDPNATWTVSAGALATKSANTPLLGRELPGVVRLTVALGRVTYHNLGGAHD